MTIKPYPPNRPIPGSLEEYNQSASIWEWIVKLFGKKRPYISLEQKHRKDLFKRRHNAVSPPPPPRVK